MQVTENPSLSVLVRKNKWCHNRHTAAALGYISSLSVFHSLTHNRCGHIFPGRSVFPPSRPSSSSTGGGGGGGRQAGGHRKRFWHCTAVCLSVCRSTIDSIHHPDQTRTEGKLGEGRERMQEGRGVKRDGQWEGGKDDGQTGRLTEDVFRLGQCGLSSYVLRFSFFVSSFLCHKQYFL